MFLHAARKEVEIQSWRRSPPQPEYRRISDVLRPQSFPVNELIADSVLKGAVEPRGAAVGVQNLHKTKREADERPGVKEGNRSAHFHPLTLVVLLPGNF